MRHPTYLGTRPIKSNAHAKNRSFRSPGEVEKISFYC